MWSESVEAHIYCVFVILNKFHFQLCVNEEQQITSLQQICNLCWLAFFFRLWWKLSADEESLCSIVEKWAGQPQASPLLLFSALQWMWLRLPEEWMVASLLLAHMASCQSSNLSSRPSAGRGGVQRKPSPSRSAADGGRVVGPDP